MHAIQPTSTTPVELSKQPVSVAISPWINERPPPLHELLSAHDVARLTRRPSWMLVGLCLIGRFPKRLMFQGRAIGWRRSEILDWMARDLSVEGRSTVPRVCTRRRARQACLPLDCATPCASVSECSNARRRKPTPPVGLRP
jgi:hypothetical protein